MLSFSVFLISFRDFIEAFLLISIILGFSKKQKLNKEKWILLGGGGGLIASLIISLLTYFSLPYIHPSKFISFFDTLGHFAIIFAGVFIIYITFLIHPMIVSHKNNKIYDILSKEKTSFILVTFLLVLQEGIEIMIFTASTSFMHSFIANSLSLLLGFIIALTLGVLIYKTYLKNHIKKLFKVTEVLLIVYGVYLICHGLIELIVG